MIALLPLPSQIVYDDATKEKAAGEPVLVEVGPRLVLNPIKIFRFVLLWCV